MAFKRKHYIGVAGMHGCMPSTCASYDSIDSAAESLANIHSPTNTDRYGSTWVANQLRRYHYVELCLPLHGNEYASIDVCHCDDRSSHDDM